MSGWTASWPCAAAGAAEPVDAVFCFNDLMAIGAMRACVTAGVSVPDEVAIAGFDDIAEGRFSNPTLSTISTDLALLSREVLRLVLSRVDGRDSPPESVSVPWQLMIRESTAGADLLLLPARYNPLRV